MNVLKFINSKSIAKYLAEINYEFNALEAAYLVWQCKTVSLSKKFSVWEEIINTMPDMPVKKRRWGWVTDEPSLHNFLKKYIQYQKEYIERFYDNDKSLFTYKVLFNGDADWYKDDRIFTSLEQCEQELKKEIADDEQELYSIKKIVPNEDKFIECTFLKNGDICDIYAVEPDNTDEEKAEYMLRFEGLWLKFPTPFKRGDIVYQPNRYKEKRDPFVLLHMCTWAEKELRENGYTDENEIAWLSKLVTMHEQDGDDTDMLVSGYFMDANGRTYREHTMESYLNLEYYDGELEGKNRFLIALSNYEKGQIDIALLANAYKIFNDEVRDEDIKKYAYFTEEELKFTGLK